MTSLFTHQATSQTEVENWIHCIHSSAATALSRRKGSDDVHALLKQEILTLSETLQTDEKLKKMAVLQLKVEKEAQARQTMNEQVSTSFLSKSSKEKISENVDVWPLEAAIVLFS